MYIKTIYKIYIYIAYQSSNLTLLFLFIGRKRIHTLLYVFYVYYIYSYINIRKKSAYAIMYYRIFL